MFKLVEPSEEMYALCVNRYNFFYLICFTQTQDTKPWAANQLKTLKTIMDIS